MKLNKICRGRVYLPVSVLFSFLAVLLKKRKKKIELIKKFEKAFAKYIGTDHAIAVSSGKIALWLSLTAFEAKKGEEIIVPAYTVPEVIDIIVFFGLVPVFVDIIFKDANMDAGLIEKKISKKTKFILMTHMHGCPCDIDQILEISRKYNLVVIEDAAQSCGAEYKTVKTGNFGKVAYYSFGFLKNLNTLSGGMIVTSDINLEARIRAEINKFTSPCTLNLVKSLFRGYMLAFLSHPVVFSLLVYPMLHIFRSVVQKSVAFILKAEEVDRKKIEKLKVQFSAEQAVMGLKQLNILDAINYKKIRNAKILNKRLIRCKNIKIFKEDDEKKNIYLNYVIRTENRNLLINNLFKKGIDVSPGMAVCCPNINRFKEFFCDCPNSRKMQKENVYLPIYSPLDNKEMVYITDSIECEDEKR